MRYAMLCYHDATAATRSTREEDDAVLARLGAAQGKVAKADRRGPVVRLVPTTAATMRWKRRDPPLIVDGPFAETKEQLPGPCFGDCASLDEVPDARCMRAPAGRPRPS